MKKSVNSVGLFIQSLSENFGVIRFPDGAEAILGKLKACFAAMPGKFPKISTKSEELLVRMTICALQTQTTLDDDLRLIFCTGALCLEDKELAKELLQETLHQTLAENSQWIQILQQQKLLRLDPNGELETLRKILRQLENAVKLAELASETAPAFKNVALNVPLLWGKKNTSNLDTPREDVSSDPLSKNNCDFCQKSFTRKTHLRKHMLIHTGERPHKCNVCPKTFVQFGHLVAHTRTHTGQKPFVCDFCQKSFSLKCNLKVHERIHTGERPFKCKTCAKTFVTSNELVVHTRTHTGEKPFVCSVCQKGFAESSSLTKHSRTHSGEKPFACDVCNKRFSQKAHLNTHKRSTHQQETSDL